MERERAGLSEELSAEIQRKLTLGRSLRRLKRSTVTFQVKGMPAGSRVTITWTPDSGPEEFLVYRGNGSKKVKPQVRVEWGRWIASSSARGYVCVPAVGSVWLGSGREDLTAKIRVEKASASRSRAFSSAFSSAFG